MVCQALICMHNVSDKTDYVNLQPLGSGLDWARRLALGLRAGRASMMPETGRSKKVSLVNRCEDWLQVFLKSARAGLLRLWFTRPAVPARILAHTGATDRHSKRLLSPATLFDAALGFCTAVRQRSWSVMKAAWRLENLGVAISTSLHQRALTCTQIPPKLILSGAAIRWDCPLLGGYFARHEGM
jgi:hypothetical protein